MAADDPTLADLATNLASPPRSISTTFPNSPVPLVARRLDHDLSGAVRQRCPIDARRVARRSAAEHQAAGAEVQRRQRVRVVAVPGERLLHLIETHQREHPRRSLRVRILVDLDARVRVHSAALVVPVLY